MSDTSVIIPTIGRPASLRRLLTSLARCKPRASEILVVDQSGGREVAAVVDEFKAIGARRMPSEQRGEARARNLGLEAARCATVLMTDDDCTVAETWVGEGVRLATEHPGALITGSVLPGEGLEQALSTKEDPNPKDYTGEVFCDVLHSGNMVAPRAELLAFGRFDVRLPTAYDNDLCYRWLRAGRSLRYEPRLRVWHYDFRTPEQRRKRYLEYWRGQGAFYGKHLRRRDREAMRFVLADTRFYGRLCAARLVRGQRLPDDYHGFIRGLMPGLARGLLLSSSGGRVGSEGREGDGLE